MKIKKDKEAKCRKLLMKLSAEEIFTLWPSSISKQGKEACFCPEFYSQMYEIERLKQNLSRLDKIGSDPRISYNRAVKIKPFQDLLCDAIKIYSQAKDNPDFDRDVKILNTFVDEHIVIRNFQRTFKRLNAKEILEEKYNEDNSLKTTEQKRRENIAFFEQMDKRFKQIKAKESSPTK